MKWLATLLAVACALALAGSPRSVLAFTQVDVRAGRVSFFADRLAVLADGSARTQFPGGLRVRADSLFVDLRANRYVWAGNATARSGGRRIDAAAISVDLDRHFVYALVVESLPRIERYDDFSLPSPRVVAADADTFAFPPLRDLRPYIRTTLASIVPKVNIRLTPALFPTGSGVTVPSPSYLFSYAGNPNLGTQAQSGATFDQPYGLIGTQNSLTSAHFRYVSGSGAGVALAENIVFSDRAYVAAALGPLRRSGRTTNLLAYQKLDALRSHTLTAIDTPGLTGFTYRLTQAAPHGQYAFTWGQTNGSVAGDTLYTTDPIAIKPTHFSVRLRGGYGFDRNPSGLFSPTTLEPKIPYHFMYRTTLGMFVASPLVNGPLGTQINATADVQKIWYAYPHLRDDVTLGSTISRRISSRLNLIGSVSASFSGDAYGVRQLTFYPPTTPTYKSMDGSPYPGYAAYSGYQNARQYSIDAYYTSNPRNPVLDLHTTFTYTNGFPQYNGTGTQPFYASFDLRARPGTTLTVELGRGYYFNWNHQTFSRQWTLNISSP